MRSTPALSNGLRGIRACFERPEAQSFLNSSFSPQTRVNLAKRVGWTVVWYSAAVTGVLWWPLITSKIVYGKVAI